MSVEAWIKGISGILVHKKVLKLAWDGQTVGGEPVLPLVDFGRVLAQCDVCGNYEYVSPSSSIFYCMRCGNSGSGIARPVKFPRNWKRIEAALVARPIVLGYGANWVERVLRSKPENRELPREWRPGVKAKVLEEANSPHWPAATSPKSDDLGEGKVEGSNGL